MADSHLAPSSGAFSCLTKQAAHLYPHSNNANRLICFCSCFAVAKSKVDSLCSGYLHFRLDKTSLKNIYVFVNIANDFSLCCWDLKCNSRSQNLKQSGTRKRYDSLVVFFSPWRWM